ncbi:DNA repair protein RadA [Candidatus Deianiraea vastatrix]|uniref:DNA repair protein RadA n=1 Tax=Candidatus Deianiraea vastatrix TaxID=2163644 RepID=A0A5B8XEX3_9RICK|nr:DNA repair protein RadA [Candidatus Deianiraea vastatrix]QED23800.1 DNA repair protein RadA [Candidatus Deianiraea vastatrix]
MFSCVECGMNYAKWTGKCTACNSWNTIHEEKGDASEVSSFFGKQKKNSSKKTSDALKLSEISSIAAGDHNRISSNISELDRVLGGGFVAGSGILISGEPGIGKSTLLLQCAYNTSKAGMKTVYISGEESVGQISMRAKRLGMENFPALVASSGCVEKILKTVSEAGDVKFLIIDSIQTMYLEALESNPGSVAQIRAAAYELLNYCKMQDIVMILVGHITKDGQVAGPKLLEHMVDVMLYFDGENNNYFRILRGIKNRFGATNEIGIFQMVQNGLEPVSNPSEIFLSSSKEDIQGRIAFSTFEGTRPVLLELESLVTPSFIPNPRRTTVGWDNNRLSMILAVLCAKCNMNFSDKDVYLSVLGGLKTQDPSADLAVCLSLKSAISKKPIKAKTIAIGEVSLSGQVRPVFQIELRIKEAIKLGFSEIYIPKGSFKDKKPDGVLIVEIDKIWDF